jgi:hypothetical protein
VTSQERKRADLAFVGELTAKENWGQLGLRFGRMIKAEMVEEKDTRHNLKKCKALGFVVVRVVRGGPVGRIDSAKSEIRLRLAVYIDQGVLTEQDERLK